MKYLSGMVGYPVSEHVPCETEKAWGFTERRGYTRLMDRTLWIPKSIVKFGEPNGKGWIEIYVPKWFATKYNVELIAEIQFHGEKEI